MNVTSVEIETRKRFEKNMLPALVFDGDGYDEEQVVA